MSHADTCIYCGKILTEGYGWICYECFSKLAKTTLENKVDNLMIRDNYKKNKYSELNQRIILHTR